MAGELCQQVGVRLLRGEDVHVAGSGRPPDRSGHQQAGLIAVSGQFLLAILPSRPRGQASPQVGDIDVPDGGQPSTRPQLVATNRGTWDHHSDRPSVAGDG
jgi:hypothetical protein